MENFDVYSTCDQMRSVNYDPLCRRIPKPGMLRLSLRRFDLQFFFNRTLDPLQHFIFGKFGGVE